MAWIETRKRPSGRVDLVVHLTKLESEMVDKCVGTGPYDDDGKGPSFAGESRLSDGYAEHYLLVRGNDIQE